MEAYFRQFNGMMKKSWLFTLGGWKTTLLQIIAPIIFVILLILLELIPKNPDDNPYNPFPEELDPPIFPLGHLPRCKPFNAPCLTIRFALHSNATESEREIMFEIMNTITIDNDLFPSDIQYEGSPEQLIDWIANNPNTTSNAIIFDSLQPPNFSYTILFNATLSALNLYDIRRKPDGRNELQISVDRALTKHYFGREISYEVSYRPFPSLGYQAGQSVTEQYGTIFFFCGIMFQYVILLYNVCMEKDLQLRRGLRVIGLKDSIYWITWLITAIVISILAALTLLASGYASRLEFFVNTAFSVNFILFFLYSCAIIGLAFFSSVFISKAKSSLSIGMGVFVLGLLFVAIVGNTYTQQALYDDDLVTRVVPIVFQFIPPFNLAKAMADINTAASDYDTAGLPKNVTRYTWDRLYVEGCIPKNENGEIYCKPLPPTIHAFYYLIMNFFIFFILAIYLDQILPGAHGEPRPFYFFLTPSYWGFSKKSKEEQENLLQDKKSQFYSSDDSEDHDLKAERQKILKSTNENMPVRIFHLEKHFNFFSIKSIFTCKPSRTFSAVQGLDLGAEKSQLLALLGHNGAGKTTTINMLTGLLSPSSGSCLIDGKTLEEMDEIRNIIGICPQHDILWHELTAREHVEIFCELKCIPKDEVEKTIQERLEDVQLLNVANHKVGTFSGGMKRRLSVALSFIGDPKIVFLDEPTTGMDPYVRRDVWNLILRLKKGRVIIMTTHSMEEADVLGDKIAIMALGKLVSIGTSTHLKNRFAGYKLNIVTKIEHTEHVKETIAKELEGSIFERATYVDGVNYLSFGLSPSSTNKLVPLLRLLETQKDIYRDFSISQTTLEEVFLRVTSHTDYLSESNAKE